MRPFRRRKRILEVGIIADDVVSHRRYKPGINDVHRTLYRRVALILQLAHHVREFAPVLRDGQSIFFEPPHINDYAGQALRHGNSQELSVDVAGVQHVFYNVALIYQSGQVRAAVCGVLFLKPGEADIVVAGHEDVRKRIVVEVFADLCSAYLLVCKGHVGIVFVEVVLDLVEPFFA